MRRISLAFLTLSSTTALVAYAAALLPGPSPRWAFAALALATAGCLAALIGVALGERARDPRIAATLAFVIFGVGGGLALLLWLPPVERDPTPLFWGLPVAAAWMIYGIGLLPMLIVPAVYAWTFESVAAQPEPDRTTNSPDDPPTAPEPAHPTAPAPHHD